jgi:hypothetical protein
MADFFPLLKITYLLYTNMENSLTMMVAVDSKVAETPWIPDW